MVRSFVKKKPITDWLEGGFAFAEQLFIATKLDENKEGKRLTGTSCENEKIKYECRKIFFCLLGSAGGVP